MGHKRIFKVIVFILVTFLCVIPSRGRRMELEEVEIRILDAQLSPWGNYCPENEYLWDGYTLSAFNLTIANLDENHHIISQINLTQSKLDECARTVFVKNASISNEANLPITLRSKEYWQYSVKDIPQAHYYSIIAAKIDEEWITKHLDSWFYETWPDHWKDLIPYSASNETSSLSTTFSSSSLSTTPMLTSTPGLSPGWTYCCLVLAIIAFFFLKKNRDTN